MEKIWVLFTLILILPACVSITDVVPAGNDTLMVSGSNTRFGADAAMKSALFKKAADYCKANDRVFVAINHEYESMIIGRPGNADLTFRCLLKSEQ